MIEKISPQQTLPLRALVLRPNRALEECKFENDELDSTYHFAWIENNVCLCIASVMKTNQEQYQIRGMATHPDHRGKQLASKVLKYLEDYMRSKNIQKLWCNARVSAKDFYLKNGYLIDGDEFDIPKIGPHLKMLKNL